MKLQTEIRRTCFSLLFFLGAVTCFGQSVTQSNPLEYTAIGEGESRLNDIIGKQNDILDTLGVLHGEMVVAETKMKKWEEKYNSYLKTTQGFADALKAGCTLYMQGMQTLTALWEINTACKINPQGIAASVSMNTLYAETAVELVKTYRILKKVVTKGGEGNMLKGSERTKILWQLSTELEQLNRKFRSLALSISLYTFEDVWNKAIAGKIQKSNRVLAKEALNRQKRAMKVVARFYRERQTHKTWGW